MSSPIASRSEFMLASSMHVTLSSLTCAEAISLEAPSGDAIMNTSASSDWA